MKNKIFKNKYYQFHNQIQTDGISCCLLFIRKDLKDKKWGSKVPVLQEEDFHTIEDLTKEQLDPNIGGFIPRTKDEQDAIWSSQISFEE